MKNFFREPLNTWTHLAGLLLTVIGFILLLLRALDNTHPMSIISTVVFSFGLMGLYAASSYYHGKKAREAVLIRLRKLDHVMIYFLIAATYTPVCLMVLPSSVGHLLLGVVWVLALLGMVMKLFFINVPRWVSTAFYLFLGWASISVVKPLHELLSATGFAMLVAGGLFYTVGAVIYGQKNPKLRLGPFGYHEIFHLFILAGSFSHYLMVFGILS